MPSLRFLDFGHRKLAVDALGQEANAIAGLHRFQHRWIAGAERHSHAGVHVKLLDWAVFDYDFAGGLVDPGDFPRYVFVRLRHCGWQVSAKPEHNPARAMYFRGGIAISCVALPCTISR